MLFARKPARELCVRRLKRRMIGVGDDAANLLRTLNENRPLSYGPDRRPVDLIRNSDCEALFVETDALGHDSFQHFHYTDDFRALDPNAQVDLMVLFGDVARVNAILAPFAGTSVAPPAARLVKEIADRIIATACFFEAFFSRFDVSTDILLGRTSDSALSERMAALGADDRIRYDRAQSRLSDPSKDVTRLAPRRIPPFVISAGLRYDRGQTFVNGVYFPTEAARVILGQTAVMAAASQLEAAPRLH